MRGKDRFVHFSVGLTFSAECSPLQVRPTRVSFHFYLERKLPDARLGVARKGD
jgi:hypothetical protein